MFPVNAKKENMRCGFAHVVCCTFLFVIIAGVALSKTHADDIGLSTGLNISLYKSPFNDDGAKFQKIDYFNPVELFYRKNIVNLIGFRASLAYSRLSTVSRFKRTILTPSGTIEEGGVVEFENVNNYAAVEICPEIAYRCSKMDLELHSGLGADVYINESYGIIGGESEIERLTGKSPVGWSFVIGGGIGYVVTERIKIGITCSMARTLSDLSENQSGNVARYFVNFRNVLFASYTF